MNTKTKAQIERGLKSESDLSMVESDDLRSWTEAVVRLAIQKTVSGQAALAACDAASGALNMSASERAALCAAVFSEHKMKSGDESMEAYASRKFAYDAAESIVGGPEHRCAAIAAQMYNTDEWRGMAMAALHTAIGSLTLALYDGDYKSARQAAIKAVIDLL